MLVALLAAAVGRAGAATPAVTIHTDQLAGPPLMGLGVELDPYDSIQPTPDQWALVFQRLDFMHPGFLRVVEPASDYFGGYDAANNPVYRWSAPHVQQLLTILGYAKSRGIPVVLGDWGNPIVGGDPRVPAEFLQQLHDVYGFTTIAYYNLTNEPNDNAACSFGCWAAMAQTLSSEFATLGLTSWLKLVGPDNFNSWDDTAAAQALDRSSGLDTDNPLGGDSWVTATLHSIPTLVGAYDSHRYATIWGIENGVYGDQVRARREQISNVDSPAKPYFAGEVGTTARQVSPFGSLSDRAARALAPRFSPDSRSPRVSSFVDSQPHIAEFGYGVWMGDMMVQGIASGLAGASAWDLDDAMHVGGQYGPANLKQWGFWNLLGGQDGYPASDLAPRPWFYTWSVLSRSFPAGSLPLAVPSTNVPGVRIAAAKIPSGRRDYLSFAIANDADTPATVTLTVPSAATPVTLARYDYFDGERPVDPNGFPVPAAVLGGVRLSSGLTVQLPSRGVVVLSSLGAGAPLGLNDGRRLLVDDLGDWSRVDGRSRRLTLDHANPTFFNEDGSRAVPGRKAKQSQYIEYHAGQMTSFELRAYSQQPGALTAFGSEDGKTWSAIDLASTNPAPAIGGQWYLSELMPAAALPAGTNYLKLVLAGTRTELGQAVVQSRRPGPGCLVSGLTPAPSSLASIPLGAGGRSVRQRVGVPSFRGPRSWRYCVAGGGELTLVFAGRSGIVLLASSAPSYRPGGIGPGSSLSALRRRFRHATAIVARIYLASIGRSQVVFTVRAGRVTGAALAAPALLSHGRSLAGALRRAHLP